uniref:Nucleoporin Nup133/Nup155-like C-terminal domain-containing protein n=1 Tax=Daphnia galeata TaxID=27404 RepID=A0A8J2WIL4_9CRUS|nr:unnamed protein product [Daphnia galeata]
MADKLLEIRLLHLENYFKRQTAVQGRQQQTNLVAKYDLLWKFNEKSGQVIVATRILSHIADAHSTAISLPLRSEYFSRAMEEKIDNERRGLVNMLKKLILNGLDK